MSRRLLLGVAAACLVLGGCRDAFRTSTGSPTGGPDTSSAQGLLTMERVRLWNEAVRNLALAAATDTALARAMQGRPGEAPESLLARLEASPKAVDAIRRAGLSPVQYMLVNTALFRAMVTAYALEEGRMQSVPPGENEADVLFVQRNGQEIRRMVAETRRELFPLLGEVGEPPR